MTQAVNNIARRYNLNDEQRAHTEKLMKERVTKFLKDNENEVWPIIRELLTSGLQAPKDQQALKRIGTAAKPLLDKARDEIFNANTEWRGILTDDQKQVHDFDLLEMTEQFKYMENNFKSWADGSPTDPNLFPPVVTEGSGPKRPQRPNAGIPPKSESSKLPPAEKKTVDVGIFDTFVEEFIKDYELDQGQKDSARSILTEFKTKALAYKESKLEEFNKVADDLKTALEKVDREGISKANEAHRKLREPFYELLSQMEGRLKGLLTTAQMEKHAKTAGAKGKGTKSGPVLGPGTQPNPPAPSKPEGPAKKPEAPKEPKPADKPTDKPATTEPKPATGESKPKESEPKPADKPADSKPTDQPPKNDNG